MANCTRGRMLSCNNAENLGSSVMAGKPKEKRRRLALKEIANQLDRNNEKEAVEVDDVDAKLKGDPYYVTEYVQHIFTYLKRKELDWGLEEGFLDGKNITPKMRAILVDWLYEVNRYLGQEGETFQAGVGLLDKFLSLRKEVDRCQLQGFGLAAIWIASKYIGSLRGDALEAPDLVWLTEGAFTPSQLVEFEKEMLVELEWELSRPDALMFLRRYSKAGRVSPQVHAASKYLLDLSCLHYPLAHLRPSLLAAASLYISLRLLDAKTPSSWSPTLIFYSGYNARDFTPILPQLISAVKSTTKSNLQAVRQAYTSPKLCSVSKLPQFNPPFTLLDTLVHD